MAVGEYLVNYMDNCLKAYPCCSGSCFAAGYWGESGGALEVSLCVTFSIDGCKEWVEVLNSSLIYSEGNDGD
jgi:hypothetical protein